MNVMKRRLLLIVLFVLAVLVVTTGIIVWATLYRDVPQPGWITAKPRENFLYGSIGAEKDAGIPYWIWLVLPRMFHEHVTAPGGYAGLGRPWEEGREMPAGFSKKTVGYVRVAGNCALCHAVARPGPSGAPVVAIGGAGQTTDIQPVLSFLARCAQDPRFNADEILPQVEQVTKLSVLEHLSYRFVLIPRARKALLGGRAVLLDEALRRHREDPHAPFTDERLQALADWLKTQQGRQAEARQAP
jgi:hypothetical protein